jgi:hypothetical protein
MATPIEASSTSTNCFTSGDVVVITTTVAGQHQNPTPRPDAASHRRTSPRRVAVTMDMGRIWIVVWRGVSRDGSDTDLMRNTICTTTTSSTNGHARSDIHALFSILIGVFRNLLQFRADNPPTRESRAPCVLTAARALCSSHPRNESPCFS